MITANAGDIMLLKEIERLEGLLRSVKASLCTIHDRHYDEQDCDEDAAGDRTPNRDMHTVVDCNVAIGEIERALGPVKSLPPHARGGEMVPMRPHAPLEDAMSKTPQPGGAAPETPKSPCSCTTVCGWPCHPKEFCRRGHERELQREGASQPAGFDAVVDEHGDPHRTSPKTRSGQ